MTHTLMMLVGFLIILIVGARLLKKSWVEKDKQGKRNKWLLSAYLICELGVLVGFIGSLHSLINTL